MRVLDVVVDASVAAKWQFRDEAFVAEAERLRLDIKSGRLRLVVPAFWSFEIASIYSKAVANRRMEEADARTALRDALVLPPVIVPLPDPLEVESKRALLTVFEWL